MNIVICHAASALFQLLSSDEFVLGFSDVFPVSLLSFLLSHHWLLLQVFSLDLPNVTMSPLQSEAGTLPPLLFAWGTLSRLHSPGVWHLHHLEPRSTAVEQGSVE